MFIYQDLMRDVIANRPAPGSRGRRFISTDTHVEYYDDGTTWQAIPLDAALITSGTLPAARLPNPSATTLGGVESIAPATHQFLTGISTSGVPSQAQPTEADLALSDITTNDVSTAKHGLAPKAPNDATLFLNGVGAYSTPPAGTVTSVALTVPSRQTVTGSPVTSNGTLAIADNTQAANKVFAGPVSGADAAPGFRLLDAADIPNIAESKVTGLTTDLAAKAPLASPGLTGVPTAPTPATSDNSTTLATTAYVKAQPQPFTAVLFWPGTQTKTNLFSFTIPKIGTLSITVTWAANFADSYGTAPGTNANATANIAVKKNGTQFGTISISTAGVFTFTTTSGAAQTAVSGDLIDLVNPLDSTLADFGVTLAATRV